MKDIWSARHYIIDKVDYVVWNEWVSLHKCIEEKVD